jgi:tRNA(Ile)-lysidine synthase
MELARVVAEQDYQRCRHQQSCWLRVDEVSMLTVARQRNLLRFWIEDNGLPLPSTVVVERILREALYSSSAAGPLVHWPGGEIRRYRNRLYAMSPLPVQSTEQVFCWQPELPLQLEQAGGELTATRQRGGGLVLPDNRAAATIRFRRGGERLQPAGRGHHHSLKKLLQEWGVPPWERNRIPLVYVDDTLVAVAGFCVAENFRAAAEETGWMLHWSRCAAW